MMTCQRQGCERVPARAPTWPYCSNDCKRADVTDRDDKKRPVLSLVSDTVQSIRQRGIRIGAEIGEIGLFEALNWETHPSGYGVWARLMQRYLSEHGTRVSHDYLDTTMWRWKKIYRRHAARFLEMRGAIEWQADRKELARYLLLYSQAIAQGRDLTDNGEFRDRQGYVIGDCRKCERSIHMDDFTGTMEQTQAGDRYKHGNAIYNCPGCGSDWVARRILPPNRHMPEKHV